MITAHLPYVYFDGAIRPIEEATVSIATHALQYGTAAFGGIRGYLAADEQTINLFRLRDHVARFVQSASLIKIALPFDAEGLSQLAVELTRRNAPTGNIYLRPFAYKAGLELGPTLSSIPDGFALYLLRLDDYYQTRRGLSVMVSSWRRVDDNAIPARGKLSGAYLNSALARDEAQTYGFDDAILLNGQGQVSEGSACNLFLARRGTLLTPPVTADILEGITRDAVLRLARETGIPVEEREIDRSELYAADEIFFCGTGVQLMPVVAVDRRPVGGREERGPITTHLQERFTAAARGLLPQYVEWLTPVAISRPVAAS